ncbi:hypothetical protein ES703_124917 [subsurface metagenome]
MHLLFILNYEPCLYPGKIKKFVGQFNKTSNLPGYLTEYISLFSAQLTCQPVHEDLDLTQHSGEGASDLVGNHTNEGRLHLIQFLQMGYIINNGHRAQYLSRPVLEGN